MIRLSPERPLADLATATGLADDAIAIARPGAPGRASQGKSRRAGADVSVRVVEESVRAAGLELVLLAVEPEVEAPHDIVWHWRHGQWYGAEPEEDGDDLDALLARLMARGRQAQKGSKQNGPPAVGPNGERLEHEHDRRSRRLSMGFRGS